MCYVLIGLNKLKQLLFEKCFAQINESENHSFVIHMLLYGIFVNILLIKIIMKHIP